MKARLLTIALYSFLLITAAAYGQNTKNLIGEWHNELQATLTIIAITPSGQITGTYSAKPETDAKIFQLIGWVNPAAPRSERNCVVPVLFLVQLTPHGSSIMWAGYLSKTADGSFTINTIWNMVRASADPDTSPVDSAINIAVFKPGAGR
jgi:hypothetical protein